MLAAWELGARARRLVQRHHDIVVPLTLARLLVHAGRPDKAAAHGQAVCAVAPSLSSARVHHQLTGLTYKEGWDLPGRMVEANAP